MTTPHTIQTPARVTFVGMQERLNRPAIALYNFEGPAGYGIEPGSTVTTNTIRAAGFASVEVANPSIPMTIKL